MVQVIRASSQACRPRSTDAFNQALYLIFQLIPMCRGDPAPPNLSCHVGSELNPNGPRCFVTNVTRQISVKHGRAWDFLIKRCILAPLVSSGPLSNMFSMRQGQAECKAQGETLYLSLGASWRYSHRQVREERNEFREGQAQNLGDKYTQKVKIKALKFLKPLKLQQIISFCQIINLTSLPLIRW